MAKRKIGLDFEIDKLTSSIENNHTGEVFETSIVRLGLNDAKLLKKSDWQFDWRKELNDQEREVYKLTTRENLTIIQGLISISDRSDHTFANLIESSSFNIGQGKQYAGVAGNLVAFACKTSFEKGHSGAVAFIAKSRLIQHYELSLGAKRLVGNTMFIDTRAANQLVTTYFKDFKNA